MLSPTDKKRLRLTAVVGRYLPTLPRNHNISIGKYCKYLAGEKITPTRD